MQQPEEWKEYNLASDFVKNYRIEISNRGRVRTYNRTAPEGRLLKGSLQQGYPIVRLKFFKPRTPSVLAKIEHFNQELRLISEEIRDTRKKELPADEKFATIEKLKAEKLVVTAKRSTYIKKTDKKRTVNYHFLVHRAVAELFLERPENADVVIHKDFKKDNNNCTNLLWVTKEEAFSRFSEIPQYKMKGLFGSAKNQKKRGTAKLTPTDILYIKEKLSQGKTLRSLAEKYKVSDMQIYRIKSGENWSEVKTVSELRKEKK